jgi:uncharacterized protein (TIGR03083 family)
MGRFLRGDVDHAGTAEGVEVGEREVTHVERQVSRGYVAAMPLPYDPLQVLRDDGVALLDALEFHDPSLPIAGCPGWDLADLAWHIGGVWNRWAFVVDQGLTDVEAVRAIDQPERPQGSLLLDWVTAAHTAIYSALVDAPLDREVWTWTGVNRDAEWVQRRMAQETAVHRWDATHAIGQMLHLDPVVAADGIDEFLTYFVQPAVEPTGTVSLSSTDPPGEWSAAANGHATVTGNAGDVVLWMWRRPGGTVDIEGDAEAVEFVRTRQG